MCTGLLEKKGMPSAGMSADIGLPITGHTVQIYSPPPRNLFPTYVPVHTPMETFCYDIPTRKRSWL